METVDHISIKATNPAIRPSELPCAQFRIVPLCFGAAVLLVCALVDEDGADEAAFAVAAEEESVGAGSIDVGALLEGALDVDGAGATVEVTKVVGVLLTTIAVEVEGCVVAMIVAES